MFSPRLACGIGMRNRVKAMLSFLCLNLTVR